MPATAPRLEVVGRDISAEIKAQIGVTDVLDALGLPHHGPGKMAPCPWPGHAERKPSCSIDRDNRLCHCFGCGEGGDIFTLWQAVTGCDFSQALRDLGERAGIEVQETPAARAGREAARTRATLYTDVMALLDWCLWNHPGTEARAYLARRGVSSDAAHAAGLGFAPGPRTIQKKLPDRGHTLAALDQAGLLARPNDRGEQLDALGECVVFPYRRNGVITYLKGRGLVSRHHRALDADKVGKPPAVYFPAGRTVPKGGTVLLVEGEMDAVLAMQAGLDGVTVAGLPGASTAAEDVAAELAAAERLLLCLDADSAGRTARNRIARAAGFRRVRVVEMLYGDGQKDLGDRVQALIDEAQGDANAGRTALAEALKAAVGRARPFLDVFIDEALLDAGDDAVDQVRAVESHILPCLADPSVTAGERDVYVDRLAAKVRGLTKTAIKGQLATAARPADTAEVPTDDLVPVRFVYPDAPVPEAAVCPPGWKLSHKGVWRIQEGKDEPGFVPVAPEPIILTATLVDVADRAEYIRVGWRRLGTWVQKTVRRGVIAEAHGVVAELADAGAPVTSTGAKRIVDYLRDFEVTNAPRLPRASVSFQMGWQGRDADSAEGFLLGRTLVKPDGEICAQGDADADPATWPKHAVLFQGRDAGEEDLSDGFTPVGSYDGWSKAIAAIEPYRRVRLALYAAFVPPILRILRTSNFVIDWSGVTSMGKTATLQVAASVWGDPRTDGGRGSIARTWDNTTVGVERLCAASNDLPVFLDDTKRVRDTRVVASTLYAIASGRARGRGTVRGLGSTASFSTVLFSTGEQPATAFSSDGGTRARCFTLWGSPFEGNGIVEGLLVHRLKADLALHHGHAGVRFVSHVCRHKNRWQEWRDLHRANFEHYAGRSEGNHVGGRLAEYAAAIVVAARLVHEALDLPWAYEDPIEPLWDELTREAEEADRAQTALDQVYSWAQANEHAFIGRESKHMNPPHGGYAGRWDPEDTLGSRWNFVAFYPVRLEELLSGLGYDTQAVLRTWRDRGWLECDRETPPRLTKRMKVGDKLARLYVLKRTAVEASEASR